MKTCRVGNPPSNPSTQLPALVAHGDRLTNIGAKKFVDRLRSLVAQGKEIPRAEADYLAYLYFYVIEDVAYSGGPYSTRQEPCPYCGELCDADWVDVGIGLVQCGPFHCGCGASEIGPHDAPRPLTPVEEETQWYAAGTPPGSSANVVNGKIVDAKTAKSVYELCYPFSATDQGQALIRGV